MKNICKKLVAITILCVLPFSLTQMSSAFQHMDVCNYTYWDTSGDYYDRLCTQDWLPSEDSPMYSANSDNTTDSEEDTTTPKEEKNHDLRDVQHNTGASFPFNTSLSQVNTYTEIEELKKQLLQNNILLEEYQNKYNELLQNQEMILENNREETSWIEENIDQNTSTLDDNTSIEKAIIYTNTPMEDIVVDESVSELIRARIERSNLRNSMK